MKRRGEPKRVNGRGIAVVRHAEDSDLFEGVFGKIRALNHFNTEAVHQRHSVSLVEMQETRQLTRRNRTFGKHTLMNATHHLYENFPKPMWKSVELEIAGWHAIRTNGRAAIAAYFAPLSTDYLLTERKIVSEIVHDMTDLELDGELIIEDLGLRPDKKMHITAGYVPPHLSRQELEPLILAASEEMPSGTVIELRKPKVI